MTSPNSRAQAQVIVQAFRRSAVDCRQIGYIETHGTGTRLGDPIEIEGIKEAFTTLYADRGDALEKAKPISIGAVKANIGHLEAAAGIAGLLKLVLMFRHGKLPPLAHIKAINPEIDARNTPFRFPTEVTEWEFVRDERGRRVPRAASISAFGIGGVNAHVVVREHLAERSTNKAEQPAVIVPLSARSRDQLAQYAGLLRDAVRDDMAGLSLRDVAFTLALGREAFNERAAIITESMEQLVEQLDGIAAGRKPHDVYHGNVRSDAKRVPRRGEETPLDAASAVPLHELATAWIAGRPVDWIRLKRRQRVPLPGPPFSSARHWVAELRPGGIRQQFPRLTDYNDGTMQGYAIQLAGSEPFVDDHSIRNARIVPAAAYVAFAGMIAAQLHGSPAFRMRGLTSMRTLRATGASSLQLRVAVAPDQHGHMLSFRGEEDGKPVEYASAKLEQAAPQSGAAVVAIDDLKYRFGNSWSAEAVYQRFAESEVAYGPALRVLRALWWADSEALAHIVLPKGDPGSPVDPAMVDGALQAACLHHMLTGSADSQVHMPFSAREVIVRAPLPRECYAHVVLTRQAIGAKSLREYKVTLYRADGRAVMELNQYTGLPLQRTQSGKHVQRFRERWRIVAPARGDAGSPSAGLYHLTIGLDALAETLHRLGKRVIGNALLPTAANSRPGSGSAIPWEGLLEAIVDREATIVLWYDSARLGSLPFEEQLRFGFDSIFDLAKRLATMRSLKRCRILLNLVSGQGDAAPALAALSGFARVLRQESPHLRLSIVHFSGAGDGTSASEAELLLRGLDEAESVDCFEHRIDLHSGTHEILGLEPTPDSPKIATLPVEAGAVYLITGGLGSIGREVARAVLARGGRVALTSRSPLGDRAGVLEALGNAADVIHVQADVADRVALDRALSKIRAEFGSIRGVFHCAGETRPGLLRLKSLDDAREVVSAKVLGTVCLDEVTREEPIDFFVLFSSLASVTGPVGAADYSYSNRFEDLFAPYRDSLAKRGLRRGRTVSVSWPVWSGGGMRMAPQDLDYLRGKGLDLIDAVPAISALWSCLADGAGHYLVGCGEPAKVRLFLAAAYPEAAGVLPAPPSAGSKASKTTDFCLVQT
jgi:polyketide synthase PksJ